MKQLVTMLLLIVTTLGHSQTVTDTLVTSIGEFSVESEEQISATSIAVQESYSNTDGGLTEFVSTSSSARLISPQTESGNLEIWVQPNPALDNADMTVSGMSGYVSINVTNVLGQTVYTSYIRVDQSQRVALPAQLWESGIYMIVVSAGSNVATERFIVE